MPTIVYHDTIELPLARLQPHPLNRPATGISQTHVETLKALMQQNGYNGSQPLTVRPFGDGYQIIEGHHRVIAASELGYVELPCVVEDLDDVEANLRLLISNEQEGNDPLDIGINALDTIQKSNGGRGVQSELSVSGYARRLGKHQEFISRTMQAAEVYKLIDQSISFNPNGVVTHLYEIHAAKSWLWPILVQHMLAQKWSVPQTKSQVDALKNIQDPPPWVDLEAITTALMDGTMKSSDVAKFASTVAKTNKELAERELDAPELMVMLDQRLQDLRPSKLSQVSTLCNEILTAQNMRITLAREAAMASQRAAEEAAARVARLHNFVSLEEWNTLSPEEQYELLHLPQVKGPTFNKQDSRAIEWAQYSWNPISGCLHQCSYCVAPETLILMADGRTRQIQTLRVGDRIMGTVAENGYRRLVETDILAQWHTVKAAYQITLGDGRTLTCSGDHRWMTDRQIWKYTAHETPRLTTNNSLMGLGPAWSTPPETEDYRAGYLSGVIRGDGHLKIHRQGICSFRLAMNDTEAIDRAERYLAMAGVSTARFNFSMAKTGEPIQAIRTADELSFSLIEHEIKWRENPEYERGFLAGLFDAEGSNSGTHRSSTLRCFNSSQELFLRFTEALEHLGFRHTRDVPKIGTNRIVQTIRILGGLIEHLRFFQVCDPAIRRKLKLDGASIKNRQDLRVVDIRPLNLHMPMVDITTGTGDFVANGVISHNCYARDIALDQKFKTAFPYGFEPTLRPLSLLAPRLSRPPKEAANDTRYKNVFTGSMADIWGRWVPQSWIEAILESIRAAPDWNFLFLTKFPTRMAEFEYPDNAWLGTTVDLQVRVDAAEKAFAKVNAAKRWLSIEPMLEPLKFTRLDLFDWIVLGGASPQSKTPTWKPPFIWVYDLMKQAEAAGVPVYAKSNLLGSTARDGLLNLPDYLPVTPEVTVLPEAFRYLKGAP